MIVIDDSAVEKVRHTVPERLAYRRATRGLRWLINNDQRRPNWPTEAWAAGAARVVLSPAFIASHKLSEQFLVSHGFLADAVVGESLLNEAWTKILWDDSDKILFEEMGFRKAKTA